MCVYRIRFEGRNAGTIAVFHEQLGQKDPLIGSYHGYSRYVSFTAFEQRPLDRLGKIEAENFNPQPKLPINKNYKLPSPKTWTYMTPWGMQVTVTEVDDADYEKFAMSHCSSERDPIRIRDKRERYHRKAIGIGKRVETTVYSRTDCEGHIGFRCLDQHVRSTLKSNGRKPKYKDIRSSKFRPVEISA